MTGTAIIILLFVVLAISITIAALVQKQKQQQLQRRQRENLLRRQIDEIADIISLLNRIDTQTSLREQLWQYSLSLSSHLGIDTGNAESPIQNALQPLTSDAEIKQAKYSINQASKLLKQMQTRKMLSPQQCITLIHHGRWIKLEAEIKAIMHQARKRHEEEETKIAVRYLLSARDLLNKSNINHSSHAQLLAQVESELAHIRGTEEDSTEDNDKNQDRNAEGFPTTPDAEKKQF